MRRRAFVFVGGLIGVVLTTAVVGVVGFGVFLQTDMGQRWTVTKLEDLLTSDTMTTEIGSIHTDLWTGARIEGFSMESETLTFKAGRIDADIDRNALLRGELRIKKAVADGAFVDLTQPTWDPEEPSEPFSGLPIDLAITEVELNGANVIYRNTEGTEVVRVVGASGTASFTAIDDEIRVEDVNLHALLGLQGAVATKVNSGSVVIDPVGTHLIDIDAQFPQSKVSVGGSITEELDLDIGVERVAGSDLDAILGNPGLAGDLAGDVKVTGPTDTIGWSAKLHGIDETQGAATASGTVDLTTETLGWTVDADLEDLDVKQVYPQVGESIVLSGRAVVDGKGTNYPDEMVIDVDWTGRSHDAYGQHVDAATAKIHIEKGVVTLENTTLDGILGELELTGTVATVDGPLDVRATGTLRPTRLRELGVSGIDSSGWLDAHITGDLSDPEAPIRIAGSVRFAPFVSGDSIRFDTAVARFDVLSQGENVNGTATVTAQGGDVSGIRIAEAEVPTITIDRTPAATNVAGDLLARTIAMPDTFSTRSASGTWTYTDAGATADIALGPLDVLGIAGTKGRIEVDQRGDVVDLVVSLDGGDRELVTTKGTYDLAIGRMELDRLTLNPTERASWTTTKPLRFTLTDGGLKDADIALDGTLGTLQVTGQLGTTGPLDGRVLVKGLQLDRLAQLDPEAMPGLGGGLDLEITVSGDAKAAQVSGSIDASEVFWDETLSGLDLGGTFETVAGSIQTDLQFGVLGDPVATLGGSIPVALDLADPKLDADGSIDLSIALVPGSLDRFSQLSPSAEGLPEGRASGVLEITGLLVDPTMRMAGVAEVEVPGWVDRQRTEFELTRNDGALGGWIEARAGHLNFAKISATGQTEVESVLRETVANNAMPDDFDWTTVTTDLFAYAAIPSLPVELLALIGGVDDVSLEGELGGGFMVTGTPAKPVLDGSLTWSAGKIGRQPVEGLDLVVTPTAGGYDVDMNFDFPGDAGLTAVGTVPMEVDLTVDSAEWATDPMDIQLGGGGIPMRALTAFTRTVGKSEGILTIGGSIGGPAFKPEPNLQLAIVDGAMNVNALGIRVEDLVLQGTVDKEQIEIAQITGSTRPIETRVDLQEALGSAEKALAELDVDDEEPADRKAPDGGFRVSGVIALDQGTPTKVRMNAKLGKGVWITSTADNSVQLSNGYFKTSGVYPNLLVEGNVGLKQGMVKLDAAAFIDKSPLEVDPRISIAGRSEALLAKTEEEPWYYDVVMQDISIKLNRSLQLDVAMPFVDDLGSIGAFVSRADLNARIGGATTLDMVRGVPTMKGELEVNNGRLKMLGRRFDVDEGRITFTGADISEPLLDIGASGTVGNVPIAATVSGTPSAPGITPECDGYPSQADCLMILITGRAPDAAGDNNTAAALAGMALGSLLGEQNVADISFDPDGSIEVGAAASSGVYLTYTLSAQPELGENTNTIEADIGLPGRLVLNVAFGEQLSWSDVFWEIRF